MRTLALLLLVLALAGCGRDIRNEQAVRQAVIDYLSSRPGLNISSMNVDLASVIFRKDEADATVSVSPKGSSASAGMTIRYTLELKGNRWVVKPRANAGSNPHGAPDANPNGSTNANPHGSAAVAPDGGSPGAIPPGHPPIPPKDSGK